MEFFYLVKATQKSGKQDAVIWFTAKSEARAALTLDVELEEAGIETGRGKDYAKPVRTDMPVVDDLPEEGVVCFEFCKRYVLADDQRTWNVIPGAAPQGETTPTPATTSDAEQPAAAVTSTDSADAGTTSLLENRTPAVRFAVHLLGYKYLSEISQEQQIVANELATDEGNVYFQNLLQAKNDVPDIGELSLHAEWKLVQAIKEVFPQNKVHEPALLATFMSGWIKSEAGDRNQLVDDWKNGKLLATAKADVGTTSENVSDAVREFRERELPVLTTVATLPFRQRLLAQYIADKQYFYHVDEEQKKAILELELDVDNSYVQNMILAAENVDGFKKAHEPDIWKVVNALKTIFPVDGKRTELSVVIQFFKAWFSTEHIDRGILTREWSAGNRISNVQRTDAGTNADGGYVTDRGEGAHHTLDTLDLEIACALLPMDFHHFEIPSSVLRRAKEIVAKKEEPWKSWSKILRSQPGVLAVNRAAIFNLVRIAPENIHLTPVAHLEFVIQTMTAEFNAATELLSLPAAQPEEPQTAEEHPLPKWAEAGEQQLADESEVETQTLPKWAKETISQPQVANLGGGVFSIEGLMNETQPQTDSLNPPEVLAAAAPELANATAPEVTTEALEKTVSAPEYPAYFEPGRYEGLPNNVYHAANGISSTQVKDARVSLMYFNARHVAKTIPREGSKVLDMGNLVHALALQPENLNEEFSVEPVIPEGAFTTATTLRAFIDEHNASLPALLSADDIKALLEEHNATLPAQVPMGGSLEETAQSYMTLPAEFQRIEADQKQTCAAMKACIKEYNATLPAPVKTSGSRDALLEQLAIINPDLVAQEAQKPAPLKVSGTKAEMIQAVKSVKPDAVFADELLDAWRDNPGDKILVTQQQMQTALAIQKALHEHPTAGKLLLHPDRAVETSYFGIDEETGLEIRVRPDLEIDIDAVRIGADLKTISMWNVKQSGLRARLHREIIDRDYHLSAAMYMQTAALDQFFWIFVNKDEGYHWVAVIEASEDLLALGMQEYQKTMRALAQAYDTNCWPAPITEDYTDELNDFDLRRLEALRTQA